MFIILFWVPHDDFTSWGLALLFSYDPEENSSRIAAEVFRSWSSHGSSRSGEFEVVHRKLINLDMITFQIDDNMQIYEYALRSDTGLQEDNARKLPTLQSCLLPTDKLDTFEKWIAESMNTCFNSLRFAKPAEATWRQALGGLEARKLSGCSI